MTTETMHEYAFDVKLWATVRVKAPTEAAARKILEDRVNAADFNAGCWENGDPILFEAHMEGEGDLYEVDGEPV